MSEQACDMPPPIEIDITNGLEAKKPPEKMSMVAQVVGPTVVERAQLTGAEIATILPDGKTNWGCPAFRDAVRELEEKKALRALG